MKVLFVTQWYPTATRPYYGVFIREHAMAVALTGCQVSVLSLTIQKSPVFFARKIREYTDTLGIRVIQCELHSAFMDVLYHLPMVQGFFLQSSFQRIIKLCGKPDIVHSHVMYPAGIWGHKWAKKLQKPHVITEHWSKLYAFSRGVYGRCGLQAYASAQFILPVSKFLKNTIQTAYPSLPDPLFQVVGNVVDPEIFYYKQKTKQVNSLTFCAVASWNAKKQPDKLPELFIDALSELQKNETRTIHLVMMGGGDRIQELKDKCNALKLSASFTGYIPKEAIAKELQQADFLVHASTIETFSIVVAEALACGVPVVCSNKGALPELVNEENGILCDNTLSSWVQGLQVVITQPFHRERIATTVKNRFGPISIGEQIVKAYGL